MADEDWEAEFKSMTDTMITNDAQVCLENQMARARKWRDLKAERGESADLSDFIHQVMKEPLKRNQVLAAYGAALWRLMEADDDE